MKDDAADDLHSVMTHADASVRSLAHNCICFGKDIIQSLAFAQAVLELSRLSSKLFVRQRFYLRLQRLDPVHDRIDTFQFILAVSAEDLLYNPHTSQLAPYIDLAPAQRPTPPCYPL